VETASPGGRHRHQRRLELEHESLAGLCRGYAGASSPTPASQWTQQYVRSPA
jgi:hypothetical protein